MLRLTLRGVAIMLLVAAVCPAVQAAKRSSKTEAAAKGELPEFDAVVSAVDEHFKTSRGYRSGDLLTSGVANPLFDKLEKMNWPVADRKAIAGELLPDNDWLVKQFSTKQGRRFMRDVSALPHGYDRVDRLRKLPYGQRQISDMIRSPDGSKLIEYMTTTRGGRNLGKQVSHAQRGEDFNKPTGKIYTETQLLKRLKVSYDAETVQRLAKSSPAIAPANPDAARAEPERYTDGEKPAPTEALPNDPEN